MLDNTNKKRLPDEDDSLRFSEESDVKNEVDAEVKNRMAAKPSAEATDTVLEEEAEKLELFAEQRKTRRLWQQRFLYAAVCLVVCSGAFIFYLTARSNRSKTVELPENATTAPAKDGKKVVEDIYQPSPGQNTAPLDNQQQLITQTSAAVPVDSNASPNPATSSDNFGSSTISDSNTPVTQIKNLPPSAINGANEAKTANSPTTAGGVNEKSSGTFRGNGKKYSQVNRKSASGSEFANYTADNDETESRLQNAALKNRVDSADSASYVFKTAPVKSNNSRLNGTLNNIQGKAVEAGVRQIPFGTLLPVRTLGAVHTLYNSSLARLELTRTVKGDDWYLPERTVIVAKVGASRGDRVLLEPVGFIYNEQLFPLKGEIAGTDGGAGLPAERKQIGAQWYRGLINVAAQAQKTLNTWLLSRGNGNITNIEVPSPSEQFETQAQRIIRYLFVPGRTEGYLMSTALPERAEVTLPENKDATAFVESNEDLLERALANPETLIEPEQ